MRPPAPDHPRPAHESASRTGLGTSGWIVVNWLVAIAGLLLWCFNQVLHVLTIWGGPQYVCLTQGPPKRAQEIGAVGEGLITAESTFFPPTFVCGYPDQYGGRPIIFVDMYPVGPWIFWFALVVFAVATVLALTLRRRVQSGVSRP